MGLIWVFHEEQRVTTSLLLMKFSEVWIMFMARTQDVFYGFSVCYQDLLEYFGFQISNKGFMVTSQVKHQFYHIGRIIQGQPSKRLTRLSFRMPVWHKKCYLFQNLVRSNIKTNLYHFCFVSWVIQITVYIFFFLNIV